MSKQAKQEVDFNERLKDVLPDTYKAVVKKFEEYGLHFDGVELDSTQIKLKFSSDYNDISFVMYKRMLNEFNYVKVRSSICEAGGTPLACLELTVVMPRQA